MFTYKIANTLWEYKAALGLLHDAFVRAGLMQPNEHRLRVTPWHVLDTTRVFVALKDNQAVYTISVFHDCPKGLPMEDIYGREVWTFRQLRRKIAEAGCIAGDQVSFEALMGLCRFVFLYGQHHGLDHYLITVHPKHARFYERVWGFLQFAPVRMYPQVENHPAVALELDFTQIDLRLPQKTKRFIAESPHKPEEFEVPGLSNAELEELKSFVNSGYAIFPIETGG